MDLDGEIAPGEFDLLVGGFGGRCPPRCLGRLSSERLQGHRLLLGVLAEVCAARQQLAGEATSSLRIGAKERRAAGPQHSSGEAQYHHTALARSLDRADVLKGPSLRQLSVFALE